MKELFWICIALLFLPLVEAYLLLEKAKKVARKQS
jgi:hypothetical protein